MLLILESVSPWFSSGPVTVTKGYVNLNWASYQKILWGLHKFYENSKDESEYPYYDLYMRYTSILRFIGNKVDKECIWKKLEQAWDLIGGRLASEEVKYYNFKWV